MSALVLKTRRPFFSFRFSQLLSFGSGRGEGFDELPTDCGTPETIVLPIVSPPKGWIVKPEEEKQTVSAD